MDRLQIPQLGDGYDNDPVVQTAWIAVAAFSRPTLARDDAAALLRLWWRGEELTPPERTAVLTRFPERLAPTDTGWISGAAV